MFGRYVALSISCLVIAACFHPVFSDYPACGAAGECPADTRCLHDRCVVTGCDSAADGEPCASTNAEDGVCYRHGCVPAGCGDGVIEPGEVCDDGNLVSGDGCSGDCKSNEVCGNGHLDAVTGEQCDDGVAGLSGDGCSSSCTVEVLDWRATTLRTLTPRTRMGLAFDTRRGRMVMFGGIDTVENSSDIAETWEYDGTNWFIRSPQGTPPGGRAQLEFDELRGRVVRRDVGGDWEYDGASWTRRMTLPPAPCTGPYDPIRQAIVCFDGTRTWIYDGTDWSTITTTGQAPVQGGRMVFQATTSCDLLLAANQRWKLCGTVWSAVATTGVPPSGQYIVYDTARDRFVSYDGHQTWELDDVGWQLRAVGGGPGPQGFAMAFDPIRHRTVGFGGDDGLKRVVNDTWEWDGSTWTKQTRANESLIGADTVFDTVHGRMLTVVGGEIWEFDGVSWYRRATAHQPPDGPFVFDDTRGVLVLFAGDLWEFDGTDWSHHATAHAPPLLQGPAFRMAYDSARHLIVALVGGEVEPPDTWIYNGIDWAQTSRPPRAIISESMAFDASRGRVVVFGGTFTIGLDRDDRDILSEFDGTTWKDVQTVGPRPAPRNSAAMAYDARRRRLVLFGGKHLGTIPVPKSEVFDDVWELDGTSWTPLVTAATPPASAGRMIFDATRGRLVMWSATQSWTLSYASLATPPDGCAAGIDSDGDGLIACGDATHPPDPDCAGYCTPSCPSWTDPSLCDAAAARCGDHVCNALLEMGVCPEDCP